MLQFETDDEDRIRGCYNSHIETLKRAKKELAPSPNPLDSLLSLVPGSSSPPPLSSYSVLVMEDNVSLSPSLSQSTLTSLTSFSDQNEWDMLHLAYIMYVPSLVVTKTSTENVVKLSTGEQSALGTTCYVISERGVDAILDHHNRCGYSLPIPDLMARLFPESRYAANPMMFHRASKVKSLVNPQVRVCEERSDELRRRVYVLLNVRFRNFQT